jgi:hypothetical protein
MFRDDIEEGGAAMIGAIDDDIIKMGGDIREEGIKREGRIKGVVYSFRVGETAAIKIMRITGEVGVHMGDFRIVMNIKSID